MKRINIKERKRKFNQTARKTNRKKSEKGYKYVWLIHIDR
jgi:hypothetical protein